MASNDGRLFLFDYFCRSRLLDRGAVLARWGIRLEDRQGPRDLGPTPSYVFPAGATERWIPGAGRHVGDWPLSRWDGKAGAHCWYGLTDEVADMLAAAAAPALTIVHEEPDVWACQQAGVPAVCLLGPSRTHVHNMPGHLARQLVDLDVPLRLVTSARKDVRRSTLQLRRALEEAGAVRIEVLALPPDERDVAHFHARFPGDHLDRELASLPVDTLHDLVVEEAERTGAAQDLPAWVDDELILPIDWTLTDGGLYQVKYGPGGTAMPALVSRRPIVLTGRYRDVETGDILLGVEYPDPPKRQTLTAPRESFMASTGLRELTRCGLPVNERNARDVTRWLDELETANALRWPYRDSMTRFGWHRGHFILGDETIGDGEGPRFVAPGPGEQQISEALCTGGTLEAWERGVLPVAVAYPRVLLALIGALAPVVQSAIGAPNFILEYAGLTSTGKTTAVETGLSCWGDPKNPGIRKGAWNTINFVERYMAAMGRGLPTLLDDSQQISRDEDVAKLVYMVANGVGKGRAQKSLGTRITSRWQTVCFITGERAIEETSNLRGVTARVLSVTDSPFDGHRPDVVRPLVECTSQNYGHAGRVFVRHLLSLGDWQTRAREVYARWVREAREMVPSGSVMARRVDYLAVLLTTAELVAPVYGWPLRDGQTLTDLLLEFLMGWAESAPENDQTLESYESVLSWCAQHRAQFWDGVSADRNHLDEKMSGERLGVWRESAGVVQLFTTAAKRWAREEGFPLATTARQWSERGMLKPGDGRNLPKTVRFPGGRCRAYEIVLLQSEEAVA